MKKTLCLALTAIFLLSVAAGCATGVSPAAKSAATTATPAAPATQDSTEAPAVPTTPITFSIFDQDLNQYYDNYTSKVSQEIKRITGVTLEIEYPVGDAEQKVALILASGEYPDMMYVTHQKDLFVKQGAFLKLDDLIEKNGPNIKAMFGADIARLRYSESDPSIYNFGTFGVNAMPTEPEAGFWLTNAALKEAGYPEMKTVKQFENVIQKYVQNYPTTDGKPTIGLSLLADDWMIMISVRNPAQLATGKPDDGDWYVDNQTGKTVYHLRTPEEKEYFRWLNHMNAVGLLDPESFIQKLDQYLAKISSGRVVGLIDANWEIKPALQALTDAGKNDKLPMVFPVQMTAETKSQNLRMAGFSGEWGLSITKDCKDPVRAVQFIDWMCTEDAQILFNWGIEGTHYTVVDGKRAMKPEVQSMRDNQNVDYIKTIGCGFYNARPFPFYGWGVKDSTGQLFSADTRDVLKRALKPESVETLKAYGAELPIDLFPSPLDIPKSNYGLAWQTDFPTESSSRAIMTKYNEIWKKRLPQAILADPAEFDKVWDSFQQELIDAGVEKAEAEFSQIMAAKIKHNTGK